ncbi:hypothetical protein [Kitasatospora sp. NPDC017646]|uniref:hypothetical protein n=1 Tax=Kitasatospora sp. NPDC017646 TaxID=3364024 RepID=UPI00379C52DF
MPGSATHHPAEHGATPGCSRWCGRAATKAGGRSGKHPRLEIVDAIRYVVDAGCK